MNKDVFKWGRFRSLCWMEIKREGWGPVIIMAFYLILFLFEYSKESFKEPRTDYAQFRWLLVVVLLFSSRFMAPLKDRSLRGGYLLLPVSVAERYFSRLIAVLYPCLFCILVSFPFVGNGYGLLLFCISLGVLCSLFWPKNTFWILILGVLVVFISGFVALLYIVPYYGGSFYWEAALLYHLSPDRAPWILSTAFFPWGVGILGLFNFVISYFRLRKMDEKLSW